MTDALSSRALPRPPESGPGSGVEKWREYAAQETGRSIEGDLEKITSRGELIALVNQNAAPTAVREAPEGVKVVEPKKDDEGRLRPPAFEGNGGPQWAVPVEGGYAPEDDLVRAERAVEKEKLRKRHEEAVAQLRRKG